jgi:hypothetical protein
MKYQVYVNGSWLSVSRDIWRSWTGKRRYNGKVYAGPVYYLFSNEKVK